MSVEFQNAVPASFTLPHNASTSKAILRKTLVEVVPNEQTTYTPTGNNIIRFNVSDNMSFLSGPESYFRFKLRRTEGSGYDSAAHLDEGGANALFRSIEVRSLASGILLQRYDYYNRYYALKSNIHESAEMVRNRGGYDGDDVGISHVDQIRGAGIQKALSGTVTAATISAFGTWAGLTGGRALSELEVGDIIRAEIIGTSPETYMYVAQVTAVGGDETFTATPAPPVALAAGEVLTAFVEKRSVAKSARQFAVETSGTDVVLTFRPALSILDLNLPLFLMKGGVEFRFELENGSNCIISGSDLEDSSTAPAYQIETPRMMAMMVTPHPDVVSEYVRKWKGEGLLYAIPSVRTRRLTGAAADQTVSMQTAVGVRSARKVYTVIQDSLISEGQAALANASPCLSTYLRDFVTKYQYKVGSHEFPHRDVQIAASGSNDCMEALQHLELVSGSKQHRFSVEDWRSVNNMKIAADSQRGLMSKKFIFAADLSRDSSANGSLSGIDLSIVPLDFVVERSAAHNSQALGVGAAVFTGVPLVFHFVEHDAFLKISADQMSVSS